MEVQVRLPAAQSVETVQINPDSRVTEGVNVIVQKLAAVNLEDARLVIAPTTRKNGSILSPQVTFRSINFNPKEDVLELWRTPALMSVGIYFKENGMDNVRDRKIVPLDLGTPLIHMVRVLQTVLDMVDQEFSVLYVDTIDEDGKTEGLRWLHLQFSLEDQNIMQPQGHILCYPVAKLAKTPEASLVPCTAKGWLWKRSTKGERTTNKQRRLFVLHDVFLYYFKKEKDSAPAGIIPLDYYVISAKVQQKKKKYAMVLRINGNHFKTLTTMFKLQAESEPAYEDWYQKIKDKCINSSNQRVFGIDLKEIVARNSNQSKWVPNLVKQCLSYISENALEQEGIFRLSACASTVEYYKSQFDAGEKVSFATIKDHNIPAALLKTYFRELPEPLFTHSLYHDFVSAASFEGDKVKRVAELLAELPPEHYGTLKHLFTFLGVVASKSEINKMTPGNLATVFGPNLLVAPDGTSVASFSLINAFTEYLIIHHQAILEKTEDLNPSFKSCKYSLDSQAGKPGLARAQTQGPRGMIGGPKPELKIRSATGTDLNKLVPANTAPGAPSGAPPGQVNRPRGPPGGAAPTPGLMRGRGGPPGGGPSGSPAPQAPSSSVLQPPQVASGPGVRKFTGEKPPPVAPRSLTPTSLASTPASSANASYQSTTSVASTPTASTNATYQSTTVLTPTTPATPSSIATYQSDDKKWTIEELAKQLELERIAREKLETLVSVLLARIEKLENK